MITLDWTDLPKLICPTYRPYFDKFPRRFINYGGSGAGKSVFAAQNLLVGATLNENRVGRNILVVRKVHRTNKSSTYAEIKSQMRTLGLLAGAKINDSVMNITLHNGNHILFLGLDDAEKIKSITFDNGGLTDIWVEEATDITYDDYVHLNLRLRGMTRHPYRMIMTMNPISSSHWIKRHFIDEKKEDAVILKTTYKDNIFIDPEYVNYLESLKEQDEYYYNVYALGEWGVLGDTIFNNYEIHDFDVSALEGVPTSYGVDYGYHNPSVMLDVRIYDEEIYICNEVYESRILNNEFIALCEEIGFKKSIRSIHDSASPDKIKEFQNAGWNAIPADKGAGSVKAGIDWLKRHKIHIHSVNCPNTATEFPMYHWRKNKDGQEIDEPVPINDHAMDALRYAVEEYRKERKKVEFI